jgi:1-acyl-sn-glycerol-3-phosphate acyltransferase
MLSWFDNLIDRKLLIDLARGRVSREDIAFRLLPSFTLEIIRRYLRVESAGFENIPKDGPAIVISNHSGYAGFDAVMLANEIYRATGRRARMVAHKL